MSPVRLPKEVQVLLAGVGDETRPALERLVLAGAVADLLGRLMPLLANSARVEEGHSWSEVGAALGVSKQAAFQRLNKEVETRMTGDYVEPAVDTPAYRDGLLWAYRLLQEEPGRHADRAELRAALAELGVDPDASPAPAGLPDWLPAECRTPAYFDSLRAARAALVAEGGRDADIAQLDRFLTGLNQPLLVEVPDPVTGPKQG